MIYTLLKGRLGNQLFIYARAYTLSRDNGDEPIVLHNAKPLRLMNYPLKNVADSDGPFSYPLLQNFLQRFFFKYYRPIAQRKEILWKNFFPFFQRCGLYFDQKTYLSEAKPKSKNKYLNGYFQSEKYFAKYKDEIKEIYRASGKPKDNPFYQKILQTENAVCVEVRLGDYMKLPKLMVCTEDYYKRAIAYMASVLDHPRFFVFSENTDIVRKMFADLDVDIEYESGLGEDYEVLQTMSACRHFIISNSSFGWWGQYLATNEQKIVIAPSKWVVDDVYNDIYQDNWRLMEP